MPRNSLALTCLAAVLCAALPAPARADAFALQWEADGFQSPESVLRDPARGVLYVSNVNGLPLDKDGNGFISRVSPDGKVLDHEWIKGLDAPKGMAIVGKHLYVTDIDQLVEIDLDTGQISNRFPVDGAKFLNDAAAGADGTVYFTDTATNRIHRFRDGQVQTLLESPDLGGANGVYVEAGRLVVCGFGTPEHPGQLLAVDLGNSRISSLSGKPIGNLDGIAAAAHGYYVSDWVAGRVMLVEGHGEPKTLLALNQGTADISFDAGDGMLYVPLMVDGKVAAYRLQD